MNKIIVTAVVSGLASLVSSPILLFTGENVKMFSDITQVQYAVAALTAIGTSLAIVLSFLKDSPGQKTDSQSGFCTPQFAGVLLVLVLGVITLPACTTQPSIDKTITAASLTIEQLALQIDQLQKTGRISNEREDKLLDELKQINGDLRFAYLLTGPLQAQSLQAINERLTAMQAELAQEQKP